MSRISSLFAASGLAALLIGLGGPAYSEVAKAPPAAPTKTTTTTVKTTTQTTKAAAAATVAPVVAPAPVAPPVRNPQPYTLGTGDVIDVSLVGRSGYEAHAKVQSDGTVLLPLIGALPAKGENPDQLAIDIRNALQKGGYFLSPNVHVEVAQVASRFITVLGYVGTPGLLALDRDYHLSEIIARVGGGTSSGAEYVILTRPDGIGAHYSLADLATGGSDKDPLVEAGDKIYVPAAGNEVYYLSGQVKTPGAYPASSNMTVRQALARAGGVGDNGSEGKVKITRKGAQLKGVKLDVTTVEPGDIINVGERLF